MMYCVAYSALFLPVSIQLSRTYKDTVLHGTFNATLPNPLTVADRHSPDKIIKKQSLIVQA